MPNRKCAIKELRKSEKKRTQNIIHKKNLKRHEKSMSAALTSNNSEDISKQVRIFMKAVDQAAAKGIIHKNRAAREKSRTMLKANKIMAAA